MKIQGIEGYLLKEYAESTKENIPEHGIAQWLAEELVKSREALSKVKNHGVLGDVIKCSHNYKSTGWLSIYEKCTKCGHLNNTHR